MQGIFINPKKCITASQMKLIAIIAMVIDHFAFSVLYGYMAHSGDVPYYDNLVILYYIMRCIGRTTFPLICFMIVQGFIKTRSRKKYLLRLFIFALISEIPFNLIAAGKVLFPEYQNTMFTLTLGLICLMGLDWLNEHFGGEPKKNAALLTVLSTILIVGIALLNQYVVLGDYGFMGVAAIAVLYLLRSRPVISMIAGYIVLILAEMFFYGSSSEVWAVFAIFVVYLYNGEKGNPIGGKYFFYIFYPVHLLLMWLILQIVWMVFL